ncbi:hypothetical protein Cgig2_000634 [Carnegiea gigantea]|uniref:Uncharacterized protein n=1 Tax=Carnegiea gigantea TaxID=171969 RepID=A0A9Q1KE94_9CARY|nr:hypothetical protein Cgig2_000634 [Carnegiea gigantea]
MVVRTTKRGKGRHIRGAIHRVVPRNEEDDDSNGGAAKLLQRATLSVAGGHDCQGVPPEVIHEVCTAWANDHIHVVITKHAKEVDTDSEKTDDTESGPSDPIFPTMQAELAKMGHVRLLKRFITADSQLERKVTKLQVRPLSVEALMNVPYVKRTGDLDVREDKPVLGSPLLEQTAEVGCYSAQTTHDDNPPPTLIHSKGLLDGTETAADEACKDDRNLKPIVVVVCTPIAQRFQVVVTPEPAVVLVSTPQQHTANPFSGTCAQNYLLAKLSKDDDKLLCNLRKQYKSFKTRSNW